MSTSGVFCKDRNWMPTTQKWSAVRVAFQSRQTSMHRPVTLSWTQQHPAKQCRPWSWRISRLRTDNKTTCHQEFHHILLSRPSSASGSSSAWPRSHTEAGRSAHNVQTGLLQRCAGRTAKVHTGATTVCPECSCSDYSTPNLIQLQWLPVSYTVKFKLCCLIHAMYYGRSLTYLTEAIEAVSTSKSHYGLCSSSTSLMYYSLPQLCKRFGERSFSHAGPATWNTLPDNIRTVADPVRFQKLLKSHYFSVAFNICWLFSQDSLHILDFCNALMFLFL